MADELYRHTTPSGVTIVLRQGDLTQENVDAIVNAANSQLAHGGGVAGAIVRVGGSSIQEESARIAPIAVGEAGITSGGRLPARWVIHAVGPRMGEGDEDRKLRSAGRNALALAHERGLTSIAFPAISAGIFGFPKDRCARILVQAALDFAHERSETPLREIRFTLIDEPTCGVFLAEFRRRFG